MAGELVGGSYVLVRGTDEEISVLVSAAYSMDEELGVHKNVVGLYVVGFRVYVLPAAGLVS